MGDIYDSLTKAMVGPGKIEIQKYNSSGGLETDKSVLAYTKEGIDFKATFDEYLIESDATYVTVDVKTSKVQGKGTAIIQDVSPGMLNNFLGGSLVTDGTKQRADFAPADVPNSAFTALVKFIPKATADADRGVVLTRCSVRISELDMSHKKSAQQLFTLSITLLEPPEGQPYWKIGSLTAAPGSVPTATTSAATSVTATTAQLNASVNPNSLSTQVWFDWGPTTSYGNKAMAAESPATGSSAVSCSADIGVLTAATTYHFRVVAMSNAGIVYGSDLTFTSSES